MSSKTYQSNQLIFILDSLFKKKSSGILSLKTQVDSWQHQRSCILILRHGALVYGGTQIPTSQECCRMIGEALKPNLIRAALSVANEKITNSESFVELLESLIRIRAFTWHEVEALMNTKVLLILEKFIYHPGEAQWETNNSFDLSYGKDGHSLDWSDIQRELKQRQHKWLSFAPNIPSMDAIPVVTTQQLKQINNPQVQDHFENSVDGKQTLVDIAEKMRKDPLNVAKSYFNWVNNGWVSFVQNPLNPQARVESTEIASPALTPINSAQPQDNSNLPVILSVDDSPIIQTTIKRALQEHYNVLLADKATEALKILNQNPVQLLLLDLTMPDVDGLEFCKTIRKIPKFQDLPIIMVTARDGLVNKMKGHIAGTSRYLTKPFKPEELREIVRQYINK
ncbi:MAG TPA: response regulator [Coleofasciculaceae cyanobacterium]|jgi:twitching motility two-component system response regulator PilG